MHHPAAERNYRQKKKRRSAFLLTRVQQHFNNTVVELVLSYATGNVGTIMPAISCITLTTWQL